MIHTVMLALALLPLLAVMLPVGLYLFALTILALLGSRRRGLGLGFTSPCHFAVLVPAHNEQAVINRLLASLRAVTYPARLIDIFVVADNCSDATATLARRAGVTVFERTNPLSLGKGHALAWLFDRVGLVDAGQRPYDAFVVLDADSTVSPGFFTAMAAELAAGGRVIQAYYTVLSLHGSRAEALREIALALVHYLRPLAKTVIGASCGLKGNGMCFSAGVLRRFGWPTAGLAEDVEFHLQLIAAGIGVTFVPAAVVYGEMPSSLARANTQNLRWEAGRLATLRRQALPLLIHGLRRRNVVALDAAIEQMMPPVSVPALLAAAAFGAGLLLRAPVLWLLAAAFLAVLALYVLAGVILARVAPRRCLALLYAPVYAVWKATLYARALVGRGERHWIRTARSGQAPVPAAEE